MKKVYIVKYDIPIYETWDIYKVCSSIDIAKNFKAELENKINNIKTLYYIEYDRDFDNDIKILKESIYNEEIFDINLYETINNYTTDYETKYKELLFSNITIDEYIIE